MSSKRQTTLYNHYQNGLRTVESVISSTIHYHYTHDTLLSELTTKLYQSNSWKRLTETYRAKLSGRLDLHIENLYRYYLQWGHEYINSDGNRTVVYKWEELPGNTRYPELFISHFYWKKSSDYIIFS